jgi:hypothetical protein
MKTMLEVIIAVKEQQPVGEQELRLTCLAIYHMLKLTERTAVSLAECDPAKTPILKMHASEVLRRRESFFNAMKKPATEVLGPNWTPGTPENEAMHRMATNILRSFEKSRESEATNA